MTKRTCQQSRDECADKLKSVSDSGISPLASAGEMAIKLRPIVSLTPHRRNARTHSRKQIQQLARSIKEFGFTNPVLIDAASGVLAGHGRVEAAKLLGMTEVPTIELAALNDEQRRSGHPSGRPKGVRNAATDLVEVLNQPVTVSQGGEAKQVTKGDALVKVLMNMATKGDRRAVDALFTLMDRIDRLVDPPEGDKRVGVMVFPGVGTPEEWKLLLAQKRKHDAEKEKRRKADAPKIEKKEAALRKIIPSKKAHLKQLKRLFIWPELTSSMGYLSNFFIRRDLTPEEQEAVLNEPKPLAPTPCYRRVGHPEIWSSVPWSELPRDDPRLRNQIPEGGCH